MLSFNIFSDVKLLFYLLWTLDNVLYFISFLSHPFIRVALIKVVYGNILQYVLYWLNLNGSILFYCFKHYFNDISMVTLFEHQFYCIFSSRFSIVLLVDFILKMAFSKWKPTIHSLWHNLEMWKLLVIFAVIKYNLPVFRKCQV